MRMNTVFGSSRQFGVSVVDRSTGGAESAAPRLRILAVRTARTLGGSPSVPPTLPAESHRCRAPATPRVARRAAPPDDADAAEVVVLRRPGAHVPPGPLERELDLGPESRLEVNDRDVRRVTLRRPIVELACESDGSFRLGETAQLWEADDRLGNARETAAREKTNARVGHLDRLGPARLVREQVLARHDPATLVDELEQ